MSPSEKNSYCNYRAFAFIAKWMEGGNCIKYKLMSATNSAVNTAQLRILFKSKPFIMPQLKDKLLMLTTSYCIYHFQCSCSAGYIGQTSRRLSKRMREHLPSWLLKGELKQIRSAFGGFWPPRQSVDFIQSYSSHSFHQQQMGATKVFGYCWSNSNQAIKSFAVQTEVYSPFACSPLARLDVSSCLP